MNYNKVVLNNETVIDLTSDSAISSDVLSGKTFHDKSGAIQTGTIQTYEGITTVTENTTLSTSGKLLTSDITIEVEGSSGGTKIIPVPSNLSSAEVRLNKLTAHEWLMTNPSGSSGAYLYNDDTETTTHLITEGSNWTHITPISNNEILIGGAGTYIYNTSNGTCIKLSTSTLNQFIALSDNSVLISSAGASGLYRYVLNSGEVSAALMTGAGKLFDCYLETSSYVFMIALSSSGAGTFKYDKTAHTCTKIGSYSTNASNSGLAEIDDDRILWTSYGSPHIYTISTNTWSDVLKSGQSFNQVQYVDDDVMLISSSFTSTKSIWEYKFSDKSCTQFTLTSAVNAYDVKHIIYNTHVVMWMRSYQGLVIYDTTTHTYTELKNTSFASQWPAMYRLSSDELIFYESYQSALNSIEIYSLSQNTLTILKTAAQTGVAANGANGLIVTDTSIYFISGFSSGGIVMMNIAGKYLTQITTQSQLIIDKQLSETTYQLRKDFSSGQLTWSNLYLFDTTLNTVTMTSCFNNQ